MFRGPPGSACRTMHCPLVAATGTWAACFECRADGMPNNDARVGRVKHRVPPRWDGPQDRDEGWNGEMIGVHVMSTRQNIRVRGDTSPVSEGRRMTLRGWGAARGGAEDESPGSHEFDYMTE